MLVINMPYIGNCLSVNHYLGRRRDGGSFVKPEVTAWKQALQCVYNTKIGHRRPKEPVQIHLTAVFKDHRAQIDLNNIHKILADALQEVIGGNDKEYCFHDSPPIIDSQCDPTIVIGIELEPNHHRREVLDG